jgi:hypothetical protein
MAPFPLFARFKLVDDDGPNRPQPARLRHAVRDPSLTVQRKIDALTRALADPMAIVRRMARRLPTQLMVFGWRPPKRPPPTDKRLYCDELLWIFVEARHQLCAFRRRTRAIAEAASGS